MAILGLLCVPAFGKKKRRLAIAADDGEPDWSYEGFPYSVNSSAPYETAVLVGPEFREGMTLNRVLVGGQLEPFESFQFRLIRIVDALSDTH